MKNTLLILLLFSPMGMYCQDSIAAPERPSYSFNDFLYRLKVRQSFQGKTAKEEAAFLTIMNPTGKESSYNYNVAVAYTIEKWNTTLFVEAQKNSLSTAKQDVFLGGASYERSFFEGQNWVWAPYITFKGNYKNDYEKDSESLQASLYCTPSFNGNNFLLPDSQVIDDGIEFVYNLSAGLEYENRFKTPESVEKGTTARYAVRLTSTIVPFAKALKSSLEIIPDYTYRNAFVNEKYLEEDENKIFKLDVNVVLLRREIQTTDSRKKNIELKFGVNYTYGSDPSKGFDKQEITTYTLKLKI